VRLALKRLGALNNAVPLSNQLIPSTNHASLNVGSSYQNKSADRLPKSGDLVHYTQGVNSAHHSHTEPKRTVNQIFFLHQHLHQTFDIRLRIDFKG
jgi:hypothetical protein